MRIRLLGPAGEVDAAVGLLRQVFVDVDTVGPYANRVGTDVRLYVNCEMPADVPAQMLAVAERTREQALRAAWPSGVDMPSRLVQAGDQILTTRGWELVDELHVDATAPNRSDAVSVYTARMDSDADPYPHHLDAPIKVRRQPEEDAR